MKPKKKTKPKQKASALEITKLREQLILNKVNK